MRAGPLSDQKVAALLNAHFVPVYVSNEDYRDSGPAPPEERKELERVFRESLEKKFSTGTVHVYILTPDAHPLGTLHVAEASKTAKLVALLDRAIDELKVPAGKPVVAPQPQSAPPAHDADALVLHLTARLLDGRGAWGGVTPEDWIVLARNEWTKLLPPKESATGASWNVDAEVSKKFLTHFYPATENNDVAKNVFERQNLKATVESQERDTVRVRLEGDVKMNHWFYHKPDAGVVEATVIGYLDFEPRAQRIRALQLVTDRATYGGGKFGIAVRSLP